MQESNQAILIKGGRVYDHGGDTDQPPFADILIIGDRIDRIGPDITQEVAVEARGVRIIDASDRLIVPGFVNAHYHSHDVLLKGCFETIPFYMWLLNALPPQYPKRSLEEVRARTLLGAAECLHGGITTLQDMLTLNPIEPEYVDVVVDAYEAIGIRSVLSLQIADQKGIDRVPFWRELVPEVHHAQLGSAAALSAEGSPVEMVREQYLRTPNPSNRVSWALSPSSAILSSRGLLEALEALSTEHSLPVLTHLYETRPEALASRQCLAEYGGSQVRYLESVGLLGPRLGLAHSVWLLPEEIQLLADTGTNVVLNPASNLKTKSGVAPIRAYIDAGVSIGLGCDNCSCSDVQSMFQAMKLVSTLAANTDPEPGPPTARDAIHYATQGGARALGLAGEAGTLAPGMKADLSLLDLSRLSFVPLNSAARQIVFSESGSAVHTVIVDGRVVLENRRLTQIDEAELRAAVDLVSGPLRDDTAQVRARFEKISPYILEAWRRAWDEDVGVYRYIGPQRR